MSNIRLSVCIPTYNFGAFIGETLESIVSQLTDEVEIIVVDGASTDNTEQIVQSFRSKNPGLHYHRLNQKGGIDLDLARSIELARGDYCWLFGGDDVMRPGALRQVVHEIQQGHDLYLCGLTLCTFDMKPIKAHRILNIATDAEYDLSSECSRRKYFESAHTTTAFFSFIGSIIVKKSRWSDNNAISAGKAFTGSLFAHAARIFGMMEDGLKVKYLAGSHVYKRSDNDSFLSNGIVGRYGMTINGFHEIAGFFFAKTSFEAFNIRRVLRNDITLAHLFYAKLDSIKRKDKADIVLINTLAKKLYSDHSIKNSLNMLVYEYMPLFILNPDMLRYCKNVLRDINVFIYKMGLRRKRPL
jgi:abequosyltransferase